MTTFEDLHKLNAAFCEKDDWYKDGLYWRDVDGEWVVRERGERTNGKGDLISNTCMKIMFHGDKSEWAYLSLMVCRSLLMSRRRWPLGMDQVGDSKNRIDCWIKKLQWVTDVREFKPHRWPGGMTRDPYVYFYAACIFLEKEEYIQQVKPPYYIWRAGFAAWRKTLYKRNWWNDFWYREKKSHKLFYVTRLREFRAWAYGNT